MIIEVLGDLFAVQSTPTPPPEPPNSAELDSARAAWAGVWVALGGAIATVAAALFAGFAFWKQKQAFDSDILERKYDSARREWADALAVNVAVQPSGDGGPPARPDEFGAAGESFHFTLSIKNASSIPITELDVRFQRRALKAIDGILLTQLGEQHWHGLAATIAPGATHDFPFVLRPDIASGLTGYILFEAAMDAEVSWADTSGTRWRAKPMELPEKV